MRFPAKLSAPALNANSTTKPSSIARQLALWLVAVPFRILWLALVIVAPLTAAWIASSLAAHNGGSIRLAVGSALLLFPVLPLLWEGVSEWRSRRKTKKKPPFLTLTDRLVLRTLTVSLLFVGVLLWRKPQSVFESLNSRGDWMLDGKTDPRSASIRRVIFRTANRFAWLHRLAQATHSTDGQRPRPRPLETNSTRERPNPSANSQSNPTPSPTDSSNTQPTRDPHAWPWAAELHPLIRSLPASVETSPEAVGHYIGAHEPDPWQRAKAVHDYVADRIAYDVVSYHNHTYPPQTAEHTFQTHLSVCAGYSELFYAIGVAAGLNVERVIGKARGMVEDGMGEGHAWNAVRLDRKWYLVDSTWDAGYVTGERFVKQYKTSYFLMPPEAFFTRHFPDNGNWQLINPIRTEGDFLRSPALWPAFFEHNLALRSPTRAESDAHGLLNIELDNPQHVHFLATARPREGGPSIDCTADNESIAHIRCPLNTLGLYDVQMWASALEYGHFEAIGALRVHSR